MTAHPPIPVTLIERLTALAQHIHSLDSGSCDALLLFEALDALKAQPTPDRGLQEAVAGALKEKLFYDGKLRPVFLTARTGSMEPLPLSETLPYDLADAVIAIIRQYQAAPVSYSHDNNTDSTAACVRKRNKHSPIGLNDTNATASVLWGGGKDLTPLSSSSHDVQYGTITISAQKEGHTPPALPVKPSEICLPFTKAIKRAMYMLDIAGKHCEQYASEDLTRYDGDVECDGTCIAADCHEAMSELNYQFLKTTEIKPVSVSLEKCWKAYSAATGFGMPASAQEQWEKQGIKAVLDSAKEQGARFEYVED